MAYMRIMLLSCRPTKLGMLLNRRDSRVLGLLEMGTWVIAMLFLPAWYCCRSWVYATAFTSTSHSILLPDPRYYWQQESQGFCADPWWIPAQASASVSTCWSEAINLSRNHCGFALAPLPLSMPRRAHATLLRVSRHGSRLMWCAKSSPGIFSSRRMHMRPCLSPGTTTT